MQSAQPTSGLRSPRRGADVILLLLVVVAHPHEALRRVALIAVTPARRRRRQRTAEARVEAGVARVLNDDRLFEKAREFLGDTVCRSRGDEVE